MSSPPALDFPSSDAPMDDAQNSDRPPNSNPLFLPSTPSAVGTPSRRRYGTDTAENTPLRAIAARRAMGMSTPRRAPAPNARSSSPALQLSSSRGSVLGRGGQDSDILDFPSSPARPVGSNRRGDIGSSLSLTPRRQQTTQARRTRLSTDEGDAPTSDGMGLDIPPSGPTLSAQGAPSEQTEDFRAIWGTIINIQDTMKLFRDFLLGFKPKYKTAYDRNRGIATAAFTSPEESEVIVYENYLRQMRRTGQNILNVDANNIRAYPKTERFYTWLQKFPEEVIPAMDQVLGDIMIELALFDQEAGAYGMEGEAGDEELQDMKEMKYRVRVFGYPSINMRDLNPSDTDKLVCIKGLVIRATPIIPEMLTAFFRCLTCGHTMQQSIERGRIDEPARCPREVCMALGNMSLIHNRCMFADRQVIRLQETPDAVPDGQTPHTVTLSLYDELVDVSKPGDRIVVTGVFRTTPTRVNSRQRTMKSLFKTYLDVVHITIGQSGSLGVDRSTRQGPNDRIPGVGGAGDIGSADDEMNVDGTDGRKTRQAEMQEKIMELGQRPDVYELLSRSLAPSIWEMEDVKKGILLQLFGGTNKSIARGGGGGGPRYRGDINVLLVGDPGTSKSQILQYVHKIAPRGVYTSGKGSSAVGLTAYVTRDPDTKQLVLESGALVLSDGGVCCIDEFDKMSDATRSVLHEVMEQQTVSIAKAGIITTLNARTSILAAANPVGSKYDVDMPITRNIDLPPTLISRFDLLYLVLDQVDENLDRKLAQHLVGLYLHDTHTDHAQEMLPLHELANYIDYARGRIHPVIGEDAAAELVRSYVEMRSVGLEDRSSNEKRITATTRQLESMIRLSEGHARMRLSKDVELEDVQEAYRLMKEAIRTSAMDPRTGKIDMGLLNTGTGSGQRKQRDDMRKEMLNLLSSNRAIKWADAFKQLSSQSSIKIDAAEFAEVLKLMENEGIVKVIGEREKRMIRKMDA